MLVYTEFLPYFVELDRICEEKDWDYKTIKVLRQWFLFLLNFYKPSTDILNHFSVEEYVKYNFTKIKKAKDIKVLELEEIFINPDCLLYNFIKKIPSNMNGLTIRLAKQEKKFILDSNGEYYLSALGVCYRGETIELVGKPILAQVLEHELQHIDQSYVYPSKFPFASDMLKMLYEGEAGYHYNLIYTDGKYFPIDENDFYYIYYLLYTLLMLVIPKEMRDLWSKKYSIDSISYIFPNIFKSITNSEENRKNFSYIFSLATLVAAFCNSENTKEIFNISIETSLNHCSKKVEEWDQTISNVIEEDNKRYQYYQFGMELSKKMQMLLRQELSFVELFLLFLEKVENCLIERKDPLLDEKLSFIDEIRKNCLINSKKI